MSQCVKVAAGASLSQQNKLAFQRRHIRLRRQRAVKEPLRCDVKALPWRLLNIMATVIVCKKETRGAIRDARDNDHMTAWCLMNVRNFVAAVSASETEPPDRFWFVPVG